MLLTSTTTHVQIVHYQVLMTLEIMSTNMHNNLLVLAQTQVYKGGDGERVLRCWKYLLPIFLNSGSKNYSYEALLLLCQHGYLLSPQQAQRLKYSRFVNTNGQQGKNIPADLHNEHLNRACKNAIGGLGSNTSVQRIELVSKSIETITPVIDNYDNENTVTPSSGRQDVNLLVNQLQQSNIFTTQKTRKYLSFPRTKSLTKSLT